MLPVHISNSFQVTGYFHVKKARLLQELQELTKQEEELTDLERQVEPARQRIRDRKTETVPKATQPTSEGKGNQPQCPPTMGTPSETDTHSGTAFDCPTALVPQPALAHSAGYNVPSLPQHSFTATHSSIVETTSTPSLHEVDSLQYYNDVNEDKSRPFNDMDISELRRLAASGRDTQQGIEQTTSIAHVCYSIFLKTEAVEDLERAIQQANGQVSTGDDSPDYAACLKHLIVMLVKKYRRTSLLSDLQEAIFRAQEMVVATSLDHPDRSAQIRDWINIMLMKFRHTGLQEDLDEAIITAREVGASVSADNIDGRGFVMKVGIPV